jgi:hypothetical protein
MMNDVADADWGPDNQIAVARYVEGHFRIEYPIGHALYEPSAGYVSNVRVSPKGDWVAFAAGCSRKSGHPILQGFS